MGLTRELAASWGRQGIRVNAIAPGILPLAVGRRGHRDGRAGHQGHQPDSARRCRGELKGVAVFLAADASNYITGQTIVVDGGRTIA